MKSLVKHDGCSKASSGESALQTGHYGELCTNLQAHHYPAESETATHPPSMGLLVLNTALHNHPDVNISYMDYKQRGNL